MLPACRTPDETFAIPMFDVLPSDVEGFVEGVSELLICYPYDRYHMCNFTHRACSWSLRSISHML
jgi:hypothetical protein